MLRLLARATALLGVGAASGFVVNLVHPHRVSFAPRALGLACPAPAQAQTTGASATGGAHPAAVALMSPTEVAAACAEPGTLIVDARDARAFAEGHVVGAIHLPCQSSRDVADAAMRLAAGKRTLIVYGADSDDARPVAEEIRRRGTPAGVTVAVLLGGFTAWNQAGLACSSGPCLECATTPHGSHP